jgi:hypothetical protein
LGEGEMGEEYYEVGKLIKMVERVETIEGYEEMG